MSVIQSPVSRTSSADSAFDSEDIVFQIFSFCSAEDKAKKAAINKNTAKAAQSLLAPVMHLRTYALSYVFDPSGYQPMLGDYGMNNSRGKEVEIATTKEDERLAIGKLIKNRALDKGIIILLVPSKNGTFLQALTKKEPISFCVVL